MLSSPGGRIGRLGIRCTIRTGSLFLDGLTPAGKFDCKAVLGLARMAAKGGRRTTAYLLTALNPALTYYPASALAGTFVKPSEAAAQQQPTLFGARGESRLLNHRSQNTL